MEKYTHRVRYYCDREWHRTGLMPEECAQKVAEYLRTGFDKVEIYKDEDENP